MIAKKQPPSLSGQGGYFFAFMYSMISFTMMPSNVVKRPTMPSMMDSISNDVISHLPLRVSFRRSESISTEGFSSPSEEGLAAYRYGNLQIL